MFKNFDLTAGLDKITSTISSLQDELSQEHAKTVGLDVAPTRISDVGLLAGLTGSPSPVHESAAYSASSHPAEEKPDCEKKKKLVVRRVKKVSKSKVDGPADGETASVGEKPKKKLVKKVEGQADRGSAGGEMPRKKVVKKVVRKSMAADSDPIGAVPSSLVREDVVSSPRPSPSASLSVAFPPEVSPPALPEVAGANAPSLQKSSHEEVEEQQPSVEGAAEASQELNIEFDEGAGWCGGNDEEWSSLRLGDEAEIPVEEEGGSSGLPGKASQVDMAGGSAEGTKEEEPPAPVEADKELLRSEQSEFVETFLEGVEGSWGGDDDTGWEEDAKVNAVPVKEPELFLKLAPWGGQEDEEGGEAPQLSGEEATETSNVSLCLKNGCLSDPTEGSGGQDVGSSEVDQPNALSQIEEEAPSSGGAGEDKEATAEDDVRLHGRQGVCNASLKSGDDDERVSQDLDRNGEVKLDEPKADERARMGFAPCSVEAIASPNKPGNDDKEEEEDESDSDGQFAWADAGPPEDEDHKQAEKVMVGVEDSDGGVAELLKQVSDAKAAADQHQLEEHHTAALEASTPQDLGGKDTAELAEMIFGLQAVLAAREAQLQRKGEEIVIMQQVQDRLVERNEALAKKAHKVSQEDVDDLQQEFERRLGAAERKVYALTKERDALKRGAEKLSNMEEILKKKDLVIKQAQEEAEAANRQLSESQSSSKSLHKQIQKLEMEREKMGSKLSMEQQKMENLQQQKARVEADLAAAYQRAASDMEAQRQHYEGLLQRARESQMAAEERAQNAAQEGLARKQKEASAQAAALAETVAELREALDRQRKAAELREEMLHQDIKDLEKRCKEAERRHEELSSKIPETTQPLLRQIESLQQANMAQAESWQVAERSLSSRLADAEGRAAGAVERERLAVDRLSAVQNRLHAMEATIEMLRSEAADAQLRAEEHHSRTQEAVWKAQEAAASEMRIAEKLEKLRAEREMVEKEFQEEVELERKARMAAVTDAELVRRDSEARVSSLQGELERANSQASLSSDGPSSTGPPPAMAAPGYKWVLVKDGQDANAAAASQGGLGRLSDYGHEPRHDKYRQEVEHIKAALHVRDGEIESLQQAIKSLEATRDSLADELVQTLQMRDADSNLHDEIEELRQAQRNAEARLASAMELLGEREERLEELEADLQDVKQLYRDQIEYMCEQVVALTPKNTPDISRENSILSRTPFGAAFPDLPDQLPVSTQHLTPSASSPTLRSLASSTAKPPVEI